MNKLAYFTQHIASMETCYFDEYMQMVLYDEQHGFYATHQDIALDFVTSPIISPWFGRSFAHDWVMQHGADLEKGVLEWGAGRGDLMISILEWLHRLGRLPQRYICVESSSSLREVIKKRLSGLSAEISERVEVLAAWDDHFEGILICNELLDAIPFKRFQIDDEGLKEQAVCVRDGSLELALVEPSDLLQDMHQRLPSLPIGYCSEVQPAALAWFTERLAKHRGLMVVVDYGYLQEEYYHFQRHQGTMNLVKSHKSQSDPLLQPGSWDITCHVNFSELIRVLGDHMPFCFNTQGHYLMQAGLLGQIEPQLSIEDKAAIKTLTYPQHMGEVIKVLQIKVGK